MDFNSLLESLPKLEAMQKQMQDSLAAKVVEGDAGGGAIVVRMNGRKELLKLTIAPAAASIAAGDVTMLEDLITVAFNDALRKADAAAEAATAGMRPGLGAGLGL
jgi:nucleoid-associated protein EbfC